VNVVGLSNGVSAIAAGGFHTCALTTVAAVKCWGNNDTGELGDGTTTERHTPVKTVGLGNSVKAIAAGGFHTCALTNAGGVKCWGWNRFGQLGDGTSGSGHYHSTPIGVSGLSSGVSAIATGGTHTCALMSSGGVKCWGNNQYGQLGDGTTTDRSTPVAAFGLSTGVSAISAGLEHTCARTNAGTVKCWGHNEYGRLGDGTTRDSSTPVDVRTSPAKTLVVRKSREGAGTVTSSPTAIDCGVVCSARFADGTVVRLTARPGRRSRFVRWDGDCRGKHTCMLVMNANRSVVAKFRTICVVPKVKGKKLAIAKRLIRRRKCRTGAIRRAYSMKVSSGRVMSQKPRAGRRLGRGGRVNLVVSRGRG
jgi:hypothetical protein